MRLPIPTRPSLIALVLVVIAFSLVSSRRPASSLAEPTSLGQETARKATHPPRATGNHLSPPRASPASEKEDPPPSQPQWAKRLEEGGLPKMTTAEVDRLLATVGRTGPNLMAARRLTGDDTYLSEITNRFAGDPLVQQHMALLHSKTPEEKRYWLDAYKASASGNALPHYLSASENLKQGDTQAALQDLLEAASRPKFDAQVLEQMQGMEEMLLAAEYSPAEAKAVASVNTLLPQLSSLKRLSQEVVALRQQYTAAGDSASADTMLELGLNLGHRLEESGGGRMIIDQLVGLSIEKSLLASLPPNEAIPALGTTPSERLQELERSKQDMKELAPLISTHLQYAGEAQAISYFDRVKMNGEVAALRWLRDRPTQ